jgi:L,D-peptidoglycan transpeptidase YkuD (ErfK/YbiS/YcfS/YnhG family)
MWKSLSEIRVRARPGLRAQGLLVAGALQLRVALGRSGIRADKREGDGATPRGRFRPLRVWWRADRGPRPQTRLPVRRIGRSDGWCEDPGDNRYNLPVRLSEGSALDRLWREDDLYDVIVEIDHNTRPRVARRGSAVFIHVARPGFQPTAGCIALRQAGLRRLLTRLRRDTRIVVH